MLQNAQQEQYHETWLRRDPWWRRKRVCFSQWLLESFQQANDTGLAHHHGLCQFFFSLYSRPKNWLVSIHYWSHQLQDLCVRPGGREGEWGNASVLANFTVFLGRQRIMGEEVSIVVRVCPLESILKSWPGQRRIQSLVGSGLGLIWGGTPRGFPSSHYTSWNLFTQDPLGKTGEGLPTVAAETNSLVSVMSCGISCKHTSGIFPNTIFLSQPERKSLTYKFTWRRYFLYPKEDCFSDEYSEWITLPVARFYKMLLLNHWSQIFIFF